MARLMIHRQVLKTFHKLPQKVQKRVSELTTEFERDPSSPDIGLHPLKESMLDPKVRGVRKLPDGYRAIVIAPEKGDTYLLMHVAAHDEAYEWAKNKRFEVHEKTGVFQVFDVQEVKETSGSSAPAKKGTSYALSAFSDDDLFAAGVPRPLIPAVRSVDSDDTLASLAEYLPPDCRDVLFGLAAGMALDEALEQMLGGPASEVRAVTPEGPGDFSKIQEAPNFDLVFVENEDALRKVLAGKLEEWRVFLHPCQRKLVEWVTRGPLNVSGSAGTGKTVALMHRAVHLARGVQTASDRILVTTFTANLAVTIKHHLQRLAPDVGDRIEVTNLLTLARTICGRAGWRGRIVDEEEDIKPIWDEVWLDSDLQGLPLTEGELRREFELVIDPNGIDDEEAYFSTVRTGRPRISREQRRAAWPVFRSFLRGCKKRNLLTFHGAVHQARLAAEQGRFPKYRHVLVDEVQDFSLEALRLVRAISPIGEDKTDPLCTVGDAHQRIHRTRTPLSRAGIEIRGRSRQLRVNYRTSEQIRRFAQTLLNGVEIDDLDEGVTSTSGDHSVFKGPEPSVETCSDEKNEVGVVLTWVEGLLREQGFGSHEICVTPYKAAIRAALTAAGIPTYELKPHEEDPGSNEPGVRLGAMKRIKGLEFRAVAMACAEPGDAMNHLTDSDLRARCERYVAATRARERLLVTVRG